jgi:hypothetical protein
MDRKKEFEIGDIVTLDRYNHIEDVEKVKVVGFGQTLLSKTLTYKMDVGGVIIESIGSSIMESVNYYPVDDNDRHHRLKASIKEVEEWEDRQMKPKKTLEDTDNGYSRKNTSKSTRNNRR